MAQHDYVIANQSGLAFRADLNNALAAIVSQNSGTSEPSTTFAYQPWADTTNGLFKIRNAANSGWITLYQLDGEWSTIPLENGSAGAPSLYFKDSGTDTGVYSPGTDQVGIATGGVQRVNFNGSTEVVFNDGGADVDFRIEGDTEPNLFKIDAGTDQVQVANLNGGPLAGTRNRIINGDMRIAQRGTSFAALNGYGLDRWFFGSSGAMVCTISQDADVPNNTFQSSLKVDVTTADTSIAAGDVAQLIQRIEGYNVRDLIGTTFTISFWVKSPKTGTHCVSFRNQGTLDRSYVKEYTVSAANTWEYKTLTVSGGLITAGNWNWTNGVGLDVCFTLACGTTYQTTAGAWQTGNFIATANQVNVMDSTANDFFLTGVQLEPGTVATPFERRSYGQELALCQRYFQQLGGGMVGFEESTTTHSYGLRFMQPMRAAPTFSLISSSFTYRYVNASSAGDRTITISINGATTISTQAAWLYLNDLSTGSVLGRGAIERYGSNYINTSAEL